MPDYTPQLPHGEIREIFTDVFFVTGTVKPTFNDTPFQFSRNMTIVRDGGELTLINTVRLDDAGLAKLDSLGKVSHLVKLGSHGIDDKFYLDRYSSKQWALAGQTHGGGQPTDQVLTVDGPAPFTGGSLFLFETAKAPEGLLRIDREGGILVSCDSLQNLAEVDQYFDAPTKRRWRRSPRGRGRRSSASSWGGRPSSFGSGRRSCRPSSRRGRGATGGRGTGRGTSRRGNRRAGYARGGCTACPWWWPSSR